MSTTKRITLDNISQNCKSSANKYFTIIAWIIHYQLNYNKIQFIVADNTSDICVNIDANKKYNLNLQNTKLVKITFANSQITHPNNLKYHKSSTLLVLNNPTQIVVITDYKKYQIKPSISGNIVKLNQLEAYINQNVNIDIAVVVESEKIHQGPYKKVMHLTVTDYFGTQTFFAPIGKYYKHRTLILKNCKIVQNGKWINIQNGFIVTHHVAKVLYNNQFMLLNKPVLTSDLSLSDYTFIQAKVLHSVTQDAIDQDDIQHEIDKTFIFGCTIEKIHNQDQFIQKYKTQYMYDLIVTIRDSTDHIDDIMPYVHIPNCFAEILFDMSASTFLLELDNQQKILQQLLKKRFCIYTHNYIKNKGDNIFRDIHIVDLQLVTI